MELTENKIYTILVFLLLFGDGIWNFIIYIIKTLIAKRVEKANKK